MSDELGKAIIAILTANFVGMIAIGWRATRFMTRMEFKVDLLWGEYVNRQGAKSHLLKGIPLDD